MTFSYRNFLEIYDAPVEAEVPSFGRKAQVYIYNSFGIEAFRRTLDEVKLVLEGRGGKCEITIYKPGKRAGTFSRR